MPRQHTLTTALNLDNTAGFSVSYGLVRVMECVHVPGSSYVANWQCGRDNSGWERAGNHGGQKVYTGAAYTALRDRASAGASEKYIDKIEDQVYVDLVADGPASNGIGAGTQGDY